jgi:TonB family protein
MLLFPKPNAPPASAVGASDEIAVPEGYEVPPYPPNALGDFDVLLEADVSEEGQVTASRILTATSPFDDAATTAARGWRFRPAKLEGRVVATRVVLVFSFRAPN